MNSHIDSPPIGGRRLSPKEATYALATWYRVRDADGSTVAYTPDRATAERIAWMLYPADIRRAWRGP